MIYEINRLINYGLQKKMIGEEDKEYVVNRLLDVLEETEYDMIPVDETLDVATEILDNILDKVVEKGIMEDTITNRDLFDTRIMDCLMPRPSEVIQRFNQYYCESPQKATMYYYNLSLSSNYIRKSRIEKNISFIKYYKYGDIEITINLSKPEKDPKEIAVAKNQPSSNYPKCLLCKENVGFVGHLNAPARQNHRIIPIQLDVDKYYLQYSPYVYYNEHCIVLNNHHVPMVINKETFSHLLSFVEQFPHYMLGSNADLPIVGGSILSHDHFQGGNHVFPIQKAEIIKEYNLSTYPNCKLQMLNWPLSTIRVIGKDTSELVSLADAILSIWKEYIDLEVHILAYSGEERHNTITPIVRMVDGNYQMDLVLRNNRTSTQYPDGIFHPHPEHHHIKKENIGLIEVMGLAILPARLKGELEILEACLLGEKKIYEEVSLNKHEQWYKELQKQYTFNKENIQGIIEKELTIKFVKVLEDAGVFKMDEKGIQAFSKFIKTLEENI